MHCVALGGTVIGTGEGAPERYREAVLPILGRLVGRPLRRHASLTDAAQNADDLGAVSSALAQLANGLAKVAQDLRLLSSGPAAGFGELVLPKVLEGSSFFPGKANPVIPETVLHACFQVQGLDHAAQLSLGRGELQLHGFETVAAIAILDAMDLLERTVSRFARSCVHGLEADEARCRENAARAHPR
jgi:aspartate ammonia-lyase